MSNIIPGIIQPNVRHLIDPRVDDVIQNIYSNIIFLRDKVLNAPATTPVVKTIVAKSTPVKPAYTSTAPIIVDTHVIRLNKYTAAIPTIGVTFYEYDRNAFYIVSTSLTGVTQWTLIVAIMRSTLASRPADLTTTDTGFIFIDSANNRLYLWSGSAWIDLRTGMIIDTYANRPVVTAADNGLIFYATDQTVEYIVVAGAWKYSNGIMSGTLAPNTMPILAAGDAGFIFKATDYKQIYLWNGAFWEYGPGGGRYTVVGLGASAPDAYGDWQLCDGSTINVSTSTGGVVAETVPDLTGDIFIQGGTYTGTRKAAVAAKWDAAAVTDTKTVTVTKAKFTADAGGTDAITALTDHNHALTDANAKLKVPSELNGGVPLRIDLAWYVRR